MMTVASNLPVIFLTNTKPDLTWSFKPIIYWMRVLGIDLQMFRGRYVIAASVLLTTVVPSVYYQINYEPSAIFNAAGKMSIDVLRKQILDWIVIAMQICIFELLLLKWHSIWSRVEDVERFSRYQKNLYYQLRKAAVVLVLATIILVFHFVIFIIKY